MHAIILSKWNVIKIHNVHFSAINLSNTQWLYKFLIQQMYWKTRQKIKINHIQNSLSGSKWAQNSNVDNSIKASLLFMLSMKSIIIIELKSKILSRFHIHTPTTIDEYKQLYFDDDCMVVYQDKTYRCVTTKSTSTLWNHSKLNMVSRHVVISFIHGATIISSFCNAIQ